MSEDQEGKQERRKTGRPFKHGGYSLILKGELAKESPRLLQYLQDSRDGLVRDVAGSEKDLSEQQRIMIDRIVSRLSICRLIEIYVEKWGAFKRGDKAQQGKGLELEPCLGTNYLAFSNSIDRALIALGLERKVLNEPESAEELSRRIQDEAATRKRARLDDSGKAIVEPPIEDDRGISPVSHPIPGDEMKNDVPGCPTNDDLELVQVRGPGK